MKYINNNLSVESVKAQEIAKKFGTPAYCYSYRQLKELFEIATTFFCFHNKKIVTMLDKRGDQIREGNTEMIRAKS